jgi:acyl-CoA oxidase
LKKLENTKPSFTDFNEAQTFYLQNLNKSFAEYYIYSCFNEKLKSLKKTSTKVLLQLLFRLFFLRVVNEDAICFRHNDYFSSEVIYEIKEEILKLCQLLKNDFISILDIIAPPDHILNSPMGHSDGKIYERYIKELQDMKS